MTAPNKDRKLFFEEMPECRTGHKRWNAGGCYTYTPPDSCEAAMAPLAETGWKNSPNGANSGEDPADG